MAKEDYNPCQCSGAGFCKRYGSAVSENMYLKCQRSAHYRQAFERFFVETMPESKRNEKLYKQKIEDEKKNLDLMMETIRNVYTEHTKVPTEELDEILKHDLLWDAKKCLEYGLIDEVIK